MKSRILARLLAGWRSLPSGNAQRCGTEISARLGIPVTSTGSARGRCLDKLRGDPAVAALTGAATAPREMPGRALAQ